ncbi:hypothetical protein [Promicromonospora aerolata]|uniref:Uncharacterized protein n=1 Tax=Promicromonospora aerolata TaxID=195749 RepID=A0ABW4VCS4_9MICO
MFGRKAKVDEEALNNLLWLERTLTNSKDSLIAAERHAELIGDDEITEGIKAVSGRLSDAGYAVSCRVEDARAGRL